jgi:phosphopantetheinyl transferase
MDFHTLLWSCKESVFKWHGAGEVDFRKHIQLKSYNQAENTVHCSFVKTGAQPLIHYREFSKLVLTWIIS